MRTPIGVLEIDSVEIVERPTDEDARAAGYADADVVLDRRSSARASCYRIALHLAGSGPEDRAARDATGRGRLRELERMGAWTYEVLQAIADHPGLRAPDLAASFGRETLPFKRDVRKLKELGLTISLEVGYQLSTRGEAVLKRGQSRLGNA